MKGIIGQPNNANRQRVSVVEFAAKYRTKNEAYNFLSQDCEAYLPPKDTISIWHLRDMACGIKGIIKAHEIKHLTVP